MAGEPDPPPPLDGAAQQALLDRFHPDHRTDHKRALRVGANQGALVDRELADALEGRPRLPAGFVMGRPEATCDVLVLGGGGAGVCAALAARDAGADTLLATKLRVGDSNTIMAEGGMQAAIGDDDDPGRHFADALAGGHFANDRPLLRALVEAAPATAQWLGELGVRWDRDAAGRPRLRRGAATSRRRLLACADYTGLEIMRVLAAELEAAAIPTLAYHPVVELLTDGAGRVTGAVLLDLRDERLHVIGARQTVIATGGAGRLHLGGAPTSNHFGATGDGLVVAYRVGSPLVHPESFQYHPTGIAHPPALAGALITEGVRSAGGRLRNGAGARFVDEFLPRDVVAAAVWAECAAGRGVELPDGGSAVWLDCRHVARVVERFPSVHAKLLRVGVDLATTPVLTAPTLHYQNGGIVAGADGATPIAGLRACGEVAGGAHGTNRLMGNALLEVVATGRATGAAAAAAARETDLGSPTLDHLTAWPGDGPPSPRLLPDDGAAA